MEYIRRRTGRRRSRRRNRLRNGGTDGFTGFASYSSSAMLTRTKPQRRIGVPNLILLLCLSAALVYVLTATPVGPFLLSRLHSGLSGILPRTCSPAVSPASPSPVDQSTAAPDPVGTERFTFPELRVYALQIGAYDDIANANELITSLRSLGAAGYCLPTDEGVRILAACYLDEASAKNVCERLNAEGHGCVVYELAGGPLTLEMTAPASHREAVGNAAAFAFSAIGELSASALKFDEEEHGVEYGRAVVNEFISKLSPVRSALDIVSDQSGAAELIREQLDGLLGRAREIASAGNTDRVSFSGSLKALAIGAADDYLKLLYSLNALKTTGSV